MLHRLYIGSNNETKDLELNKILSIIGEVFIGFSVQEITGYWNSERERTAVVDIETDDADKVKALAVKLKQELKQESVGYLPMPVAMEFL